MMSFDKPLFYHGIKSTLDWDFKNSKGFYFLYIPTSEKIKDKLRFISKSGSKDVLLKYPRIKVVIFNLYFFKLNVKEKIDVKVDFFQLNNENSLNIFSNTSILLNPISPNIHKQEIRLNNNLLFNQNIIRFQKRNTGSVSFIKRVSTRNIN